MKKFIIITTIILIATFVLACAPKETTQETTDQLQTQTSGEDIVKDAPSPSEVACPHGRVHEDYPGCGLFRDSDGSGYCDYSE